MGKDLARVSVVLTPGVSMNGVEGEVRKKNDLKSRRERELLYLSIETVKIFLKWTDISSKWGLGSWKGHWKHRTVRMNSRYWSPASTPCSVLTAPSTLWWSVRSSNWPELPTSSKAGGWIKTPRRAAAAARANQGENRLKHLASHEPSKSGALAGV